MTLFIVNFDFAIDIITFNNFYFTLQHSESVIRAAAELSPSPSFCMSLSNANCTWKKKKKNLSLCICLSFFFFFYHTQHSCSTRNLRFFLYSLVICPYIIPPMDTINCPSFSLRLARCQFPMFEPDSIQKYFSINDKKYDLFLNIADHFSSSLL